MATANDIIVRAFNRIGIRASETAIEADEAQDALSLLNDMLVSWEESGLVLGFSPIPNLTSIVRIPRGTEFAVKENLAVRLAPEYSREIPDILVASANDAMKDLLQRQGNIGDVDMPGTLPLGSGNRCPDGDERIFFSQKDKSNF